MKVPGILRVEGQGRHLPFLVALVVLFALYPVMVELDLMRWFRLAFVAVLLVAVYSLGGTRRHLTIGLSLWVPTLVAQVAMVANASRVAAAVASVLGMAFLGYVVVVVFASVLRKGKVTWDRIFGAVAVYLLLGLLWAMAYGLLVTLDPDALKVPAVLAERLVQGAPGSADYAFIYYSFVTLTTLGYGDITPVEPVGQALAWMEAATGQLYVAILIAPPIEPPAAPTDRKK